MSDRQGFEVWRFFRRFNLYNKMIFGLHSRWHLAVWGKKHVFWSRITLMRHAGGAKFRANFCRVSVDARPKYLTGNFMSNIDKATVAKIARLARIKIEDEKLEPLAGELNNILGWVEQLGEVNTDNIEPMASVVDAKLRWRADEVTDGNKQESVLKNAPKPEFGFFAVPKVIE